MPYMVAQQLDLPNVSNSEREALAESQNQIQSSNQKRKLHKTSPWSQSCQTSVASSFRRSDTYKGYIRRRQKLCRFRCNPNPNPAVLPKPRSNRGQQELPYSNTGYQACRERHLQDVRRLSDYHDSKSNSSGSRNENSGQTNPHHSPDNRVRRQRRFQDVRFKQTQTANPSQAA